MTDPSIIRAAKFIEHLLETDTILSSFHMLTHLILTTLYVDTIIIPHFIKWKTKAETN